ncbi:MAG: phosphoenolpyruvate--protein phosphotransferase [PS1 clade bacterium]|uniref:phosphoenolpyruvate--protein phosphotransferase n=1 Tax=PS1 clade bacterium TaxID=2175152 RepID=A0A937HNE6_9PROT|nr:phosphoenolpyruvate--protein phosphotransferase [PS1 clade bacterium]
MADGGDRQERLDKIVQLIATSMNTAVCSVYLRRGRDGLELCATEGLNPDSVHKTVLHIGEGLVGDIAQHKRPLNLADAPSHPRFAYRPETGEDPYLSFVGVPVLRGGDVTGVLVVQNTTKRNFADQEVEALQTVAMVLAEMLSASGEETATVDDADAAQLFTGRGLTEGLAMGHVVLHEPRVEVTRLISDDAEEEDARLSAAMYKLRRNVDDLLATEDVSHAGEHLQVLEAYRMFANDRGWIRRIRDAIATGLTAEAAVEQVNNAMRARLGGRRDAYLRDRLHDFEDLSNRLLRILSGRAELASEDKLPRDGILLARTMGPAELLDYDRKKLRGLVLEESALGAHVAIVARALNLPMLGDVRGIVNAARDGQEIILDTDSEEAHLNPPADIVAAYSNRARLRARRMQRYARIKHLPAVTRDGDTVRLDKNAGLMVDVETLEDSGADNIGLFRTELQFMVAARLPRQSEQEEVYRAVLDKVGARDVVFRTLDVGGDKVLPYLNMAVEENPAMGWRATRMALDRPALVRVQLRALLRAAAGRKLSVMFPLITTKDEFVISRDMLYAERDRLQQFGHKVPETIEVGAMLEVPALVWQLDQLLPEVDFLSVGTNDLMQFFFAADRGNPQTSDRYDFLSLPALRLLAHVRELCAVHRVPVSICGELGGRPLEAMALLGLGYRRFSLPSASIGPVKRMVRSVNGRRLERAVAEALTKNRIDMRAPMREIADAQGVKL